MKIDIAFTPRELNVIYSGDQAVIAVDVLRASTTIINALYNGACKIIPFSEPEQVFSESKKYKKGDVLLCGERNSFKILGFDLGNSPLEYQKEVIAGKTLLFTTANGTKIFSITQDSELVAVGGFINLDSVVDLVLSWNRDVIIACAGNNCRMSFEDCICAGMFLNRLVHSKHSDIAESDNVSVASMLYNTCRDDIRSAVKSTVHGRYLAHLGFETDIDFASSVDLISAVPVMKNSKLAL